MPIVILVNAGSALIWVSIIHLIIINAAIGYIESNILEKYNLRNRAWVIIIGNYVSMFFGYFLIIPHLVHSEYGRDLDSASLTNLGFAFLVSFGATLIFEYSFYVASLKNRSERKKLLKPYLIANFVTNIGMMCVYYILVATSR